MQRIILYLIPLLISSTLIFFAHYDELWLDFWKNFKVPAQSFPFGDLDYIIKALEVKNSGFNPYLENPMGIRYVYPSIWLHIFEIFNLEKYINFRIFNFLIIYTYVFIYLDLYFKFKNRYSAIVLFLLFFSSANLLVIERLNLEIIIFIFVYVLAVSKNYYSRILVFILAIFSKIYPIFAIFIFSRNKLNLSVMICCSLIILFLMKTDISMLMKYGNEVALNIAYGVPTLTKGIWYYSSKLGYFINDENYQIFKYSSILLACVYSAAIMLISFKFRNKQISESFNLDEKLFICGAGIFIGRFIFNSNLDYSLIFLIFTIPYILSKNSKILKILLFASLILIFNSIIFEGGNRYSFLYFYKAVIIHSIKIIIFSIMCFFFGQVLNKHLKF